jgi:hypothetical protein
MYYPSMTETRIPGQKSRIIQTDPWRSLVIALFFSVMLDCGKLGAKRARQWRRSGQDWEKSYFRKQARRSAYRNTYCPEIYKEYRVQLDFLYSRRFALMCDKLGLDEDNVRAFYIRLMTGGYVDTE